MRVIGKPDTYQHLRARMLGYDPTRFDDVKSYCLRPARLEHYGTGYYSYILGYYPWFLLFRAVRNRSPEMVAGYLTAWMRRERQQEIKPLVRMVQRERIKHILRLTRETSSQSRETARKAELALYERDW
jgi:hypothetical protein